MPSLFRSFLALFGPGRWGLPLTLWVLAVSFEGVAVAVRWAPDPSREPAGLVHRQAVTTTETEQVQQAAQEQHVRVVLGVARGLVLAPLGVVAAAALLRLVAWTLALPLTFRRAFSILMLALLPVGLGEALHGAVALAYPTLDGPRLQTLLPSHLGILFPHVGPPGSRALRAFDVFALWGVARTGLGFAQATVVSRWRGLAVAAVFYAAYAGIFLVAHPGWTGGFQ